QVAHGLQSQGMIGKSSQQVCPRLECLGGLVFVLVMKEQRLVSFELVGGKGQALLETLLGGEFQGSFFLRKALENSRELPGMFRASIGILTHAAPDQSAHPVPLFRSSPGGISLYLGIQFLPGKVSRFPGMAMFQRKRTEAMELRVVGR